MEFIVFILNTVFISMIVLGLMANLLGLERTIAASSEYQRHLMKVAMLVPIGLVGLIAVFLAA